MVIWVMRIWTSEGIKEERRTIGARREDFLNFAFSLSHLI